MDITIIVLPDGTEIASGEENQNAVVSCTIMRKVNSGADLTLGSACAAMAEIKLILHSDRIPIAAGDEIKIFKQSERERVLCGLFTCEKPKVTGNRKLSVTAYDRITWLDKDLTDWLSGLRGWPYSLLNFSQMVCQKCGLTLSGDAFPNAGYMVRKFEAKGVTGRNLIQWAAQAAASFCRATPQGNLEFAWFTPASMDIGASEYDCEVRTGYDLETGSVITDSDCIYPEYALGILTIQTSLLSGAFAENTLSVVSQNTGKKVPYYLGSFKRQDYQIDPIDQVQIQYSDSDTGTRYPDGAAKNAYKITGNFLLTAETTQELISVAQAIYDRLKAVSYTPLKIDIPTDNDITAGKTVRIVSRDGTAVTTYVMSAKDTGAKRAIVSEGSKNRDSVTVINNRKFEALTGKYLEIQSSIDGVNVKVGETNKAVTEVDAKADRISARVEEVDQSTANTFKDFSDAVSIEFEEIRNQLDGVVDTWYGEEIPTAANFPAADWVTPQDKEKHSGDLYYVVGTGPDSGNAYRWIFLNGRWYWDKLANSDIAKALEAAAKAQDTADHKRRVFVSTPYTPYDQGDLWAQGDTGELMRCNVPRQSGAYRTSDWGPATDTGKKVADIKVTTDGITANVTDLTNSTNERFADVKITTDGIKTGVSSLSSETDKKFSDVKITTDAISASVTNLAKDTGKKFADVKVTTDAIGASVTDLAADTQSKFNQTADEISAKVSENGGTSSFGWILNDNSWELKSNGITVFKANKNGAYVSGEIQASSGKIGGWEINSQNWLIGSIPGGDLRTIMAPPGSAGTDGRVFLAGGGESNGYNYPFEVWQDGTFRSIKGKIGGWTIDKTSLHIEDPKNNKSLEISANNGLYGGMTGKKWYIQMNGDTYFENAAVKGRIEASSGKIGGWNIDKQILGNTLVSGVADGNRVGLAPGIDPKTEEYKPKDGLCFWAGAYWHGGIVDYEKAPFKVYADGSLYASKGTFKGTIEAESGYFHGKVRAGKIEYGSTAGYVPKAGLDQTARDELGYADFSNQVFNGVAQAQNIGTNVLRVVSNMFFRGGQIGVKRLAGQDVLVVLPKEASIEEVN